VKREDFLWAGDQKSLAYVDEPVLLGGTFQTISAPHMVVMMLEALELSPGMSVLEVGTGSGYNAAVMAEIVSRNAISTKPLITTLERNNELVKFAAENLKRAGFEKTVKVIHGDGSLGYPPRSEKETYDRIIVTAATPEIPAFLKAQLKTPGILLAPVGSRSIQTLVKLRKTSGSLEPKEEKLVECIFVPMIGEDAF
jgi:protein-L-isoaspartate(D-aspartate) O-methyltransferase